MSSTDAHAAALETNAASGSAPQRRIREVCARALTDFETPRELVRVMTDAIYAHKRLYEDANILHRDINPNTIIIFDEPHSTQPGQTLVKGRGGVVDYDMPLRMKRQ